jgi:hypothetical protein
VIADKLNVCAEELATALKDYHAVKSVINSKNSKYKNIELRLIDNFDVSASIPQKSRDEAYRLLIGNDNILIEALTNKGIFYGCMSLIQLIERAVDRNLQGMEIIDWPELQIRGISDDISRGQVSNIGNFKKIIKHISRYKMNTYMPYIEDVMLFDQYPSIGYERGALSKKNIEEIIEYADIYFVEVIPIFQTLGHYENILSHPEFLEFAEFPGAASLNVSNDKTYIFLENLLKEVFEIFSSEYFHMGADESFDVGLGASKKLKKEHGIAKIHAQHYKKVYDICKKYNKKVMMYGDIILNHPEILEMIPKDIIIVDWHYGVSDSYMSTKTFMEAGFDYIVSPSVWNFTSTFPNYSLSIPNTKYIIKEGIANGAMGMINSNWGDFGAETLKELVLFGYSWSAQCSWNLNSSNAGIFSQDYFQDFFGVDDSKAELIYQTFSQTYNQILWNELWRHPLLEFRNNAWWEPNVSPVARVSWMDWTLTNMEENISILKSKVKRNRDHLDIIEFLINLNQWYKLKLGTQFILHKKFNDEEIDKENCKRLIDRNIAELEKLKPEYVILWTKYYMRENLWMIEEKFDRMIQYFKEIKEQIDSDEIDDPLISSKWIYYSKSKKHRANEAKFRKTFRIEDKVDKAKLQLMADTYAKLYINGKYVNEVYVKRSLSLYTEYERIKMIDISTFLKKGKNTIEVVAEKFTNNKGAGINIISEITMGDEKLKISTDDSWRVKSLSIKRGSWKKAVEIDYPSLVIAPNFETGRASWIER